MKGVRQITFTLGAALLLMSGGITGQEKGTKKEEPKKEEVKKETKKPSVSKSKYKGQLPQNWGQLGLTDDQKQSVYRIQSTYNEQIDALEEQIKELKSKMSEERSKVLSAEQKKRLEEILKAKSGGS